jgi:hypothetical protein
VAGNGFMSAPTSANTTSATPRSTPRVRRPSARFDPDRGESNSAIWVCASLRLANMLYAVRRLTVEKEEST